mmetsp:Transcript_62816/g.141900  ORF Transcript_62816/g.141900 Transcript_62816/m.141900 type:complete len:658 (-) Transcript_62816:67-2040(-)
MWPALAALVAASLPPSLFAREHGHLRPAGKVQHLLIDIDESVRKAGGDAEMVFATLYTYDQQLEVSLQKEIGVMSDTLIKLQAMQDSYNLEISSSKAKLQQLNVEAGKANQSMGYFKAGAARTGKKFDGLLGSVKNLVILLQSAAVTTTGSLATAEAPDARGEPSRIYGAIRRLLAANPAVKQKFPDVFLAFGSDTQLALLSTQTTHQRKSLRAPVAQAPRVKMTKHLLERTVSALKMVETKLHLQKSQSLLMLSTKRQTLSSQVAMATTSGVKQQGMDAENGQKAQELTFSITFTSAVVGLDKTFLQAIRDSVKSKAQMVEAVRTARQNMFKTLKELLDLLRGQYSVEDRPVPAPAGMSFLQVEPLSTHAYLPPSLINEMETAVRNKADTHDLLLKIKARFEEEKELDSTTARGVMEDLGGVLREVDSVQSKMAEVKQHCRDQGLASGRQAQSLKSNLALMGTVQMHSKAAIWAAKSNLQRISAKMQALKSSGLDFSRIYSRAINTLKGHSRDRATILAAVQKASNVVESSAAAALMGQMYKQLQTLEETEREYRAVEASFKASLVAYLEGYHQLLQERRVHFQSSLSALELYTSEVAGDMAEQSASLGMSGDIDKQDKDLCDSILKFYANFAERHAQLTDDLQRVIPRVPLLEDH